MRQSLEAIPIDHEGKPMYFLRDLEGLTQEGIALSGGGMLLASFMDGSRKAAEISTLFAKSTGNVLKDDEIIGLAEHLEKNGFLEDANAVKKRKAILQEFLDSPVRKAQLQGSVYRVDTLELAKQLGGYMKDAKGPGKMFADNPAGTPPIGLVVPHIDFPRGGPAYAWAYQALSETPPPDLILAFGVAHMSPDSPWVMTEKTYETPYGSMALAKELYADIKSTLWYDPKADEAVHRGEHSLEFQAVWLKHLWKDDTPPWVPILCSTFERFSPDKPPSGIKTINDAIDAMADKLKKRVAKGQRVMILAGVDLAHVGPRFGDEETLGPELEARIKKEDLRSLEHAMALDADAFYSSIIADGHWRKVCGLSALYTSLRLIKALGGKPGRQLTYAQAPDPMGGIVSFASAVYPAS